MHYTHRCIIDHPSPILCWFHSVVGDLLSQGVSFKFDNDRKS